VYARPFAHTGESRSVPPSCITRGSATADETGYTDAVRVAARADANVAEMATLFATMLTLLVGMGTIKVQDDAGNTLTDPTKQEHRLTQAEAGAFYVIICASRASLVHLHSCDKVFTLLHMCVQRQISRWLFSAP